MRLSSALAAATLAVSATANSGCQTLKDSLPGSVYAPSTSVYKYESQEFWSNTEILSPGCVFRPKSGEQLAKGVKGLVDARAQFAVRGGGHMGIKVFFFSFLNSCVGIESLLCMVWNGCANELTAGRK